MRTHAVAIKNEQNCCKRIFDDCLIRLKHKIDTEKLLFLRQGLETLDKGGFRKLTPKAVEHFKVHEMWNCAAVLKIRDNLKVVSFDLIEPAPP